MWVGSYTTECICQLGLPSNIIFIASACSPTCTRTAPEWASLWQGAERVCRLKTVSPKDRAQPTFCIPRHGWSPRPHCPREWHSMSVWDTQTFSGVLKRKLHSMQIVFYLLGNSQRSWDRKIRGSSPNVKGQTGCILGFVDHTLSLATAQLCGYSRKA